MVIFHAIKDSLLAPPPTRDIITQVINISTSHGSFTLTYKFYRSSNGTLGTSKGEKSLDTAKTIFPPDDRQLINPTNVWPYRMIGRIVARYSDGSASAGSGVLINSHHVLTAAHMLAQSRTRFPTSITFTPAQNGGHQPYGTTQGTAVAIEDRFFDGTVIGNDEFDYGILFLGENIGDELGYMGLISLPSMQGIRISGTLTGYPGDKPQTMWGETKQILEEHENVFFHRLDSVGGQSGSPFWETRQFHTGPNDLVDLMVMGVHAKSNPNYNMITRITEHRLHNIVYWMANDLNR